MTEEGLYTEDLSVVFQLPDLDIRAVDGVTARFPSGQITGLIGESGCGKSVLGFAALGLPPPYAKVGGSLFLNGTLLAPKTARERLGLSIGLIPQNPADSLNPAPPDGCRRTSPPRAWTGTLCAP